MAVFIYRAKKDLNQVVESEIQAESLEKAVEQLSQQGLTPISIEPKPLKSEAYPFPKRPSRLRLSRLSVKDTIIFTQKLHSLLKSQVELLTALKIISQQSSKLIEQKMLLEINKNIKEGMQFSQALAQYPAYFSSFYINVIRSGESSGRLKESLEQILNHLRRIQDLRMKIHQTLAYPIFMILVGIATIFVMLTFVLPRLATMFSDFETALPAPTRLLLTIGDFFQHSWFLILGLLAALTIFFWQKIKLRQAGFLGQMKYSLPLIRNIVSKQAIANFSTSLALLLKSGINLLEALQIAIPIIENKNYIQILSQVQFDIKDGKSFASSLGRFKLFPDFFIQMIKVGEEAGRLETVLWDITQAYQEEIEADLKIITSLLEPAIILILGLIIGGMVISVLLPIFNINALIG